MTKRPPPEQPVRKSTQTPEKQKRLKVRTLLETQKDRDLKEQQQEELLVLLEHLADSQETTIRMVLERLYDMGVINFANNRINFHPLNRMVKSVAKLPKSIAIEIGLYWFKKNYPEPIAKWLASQVEFEPLELPKKIEEGLSEVEVKPNPEIETRDLVPRALRDREVKELRSQVQWLAGGLALSIALLGGTTAWLGYNLQLVQTQVREAVPEGLVRDRH